MRAQISEQPGTPLREPKRELAGEPKRELLSTLQAACVQADTAARPLFADIAARLHALMVQKD